MMNRLREFIANLCSGGKQTLQPAPSDLTDIQSQRFRNVCQDPNGLRIWLDSTIVQTNDSHNTIVALERCFNPIHTFTDSEECIDSLIGMTNEKISMVISDKLGEHVVPRIHNLSQLNCIYVFCTDKSRHEQWTKDWRKIQGVFTDISLIGDALKKEGREDEQNNISLSFAPINGGKSDQANQSFMYTQVLKDILLSIPFKQSDLKTFITLWHKYNDNNKQSDIIDELKKTYCKKNAIWWYTRDSFLYRKLNQALRLMEFDVLIEMGFFIRDLHQQIELLHLKQYRHGRPMQPFVVYRRQPLSKNDFDQMMNTKGGLVAFNSFLSTSMDRAVALTFIQQVLTGENVDILFVMTIDPSISSHPFASIKGFSFYDHEKEILFSTHTVFRIRSITLISGNDRRWEVELALTNDNEPKLRELTECIREETEGFTGWDRLGRFLMKLGRLNEAEQLYNAMLYRSSNDYHQANAYNQLGSIKDQQCQFAEAITAYQRSLDILSRISSKESFDLASAYDNIGIVYSRMGDYPKALIYFEKALEIREKIFHPNHLDVARSYNNLGLLYKNMGDYTKALSFLNKALHIREKNLPSNHPDLAHSYNNLGLVYTQMGNHSNATSCHEKALGIQIVSLPADHPDLLKTISYCKSNLPKLDGEKIGKCKIETIKTLLQTNHCDLGMDPKNFDQPEIDSKSKTIR